MGQEGREVSDVKQGITDVRMRLLGPFPLPTEKHDPFSRLSDGKLVTVLRKKTKSWNFDVPSFPSVSLRHTQYTKVAHV